MFIPFDYFGDFLEKDRVRFTTVQEKYMEGKFEAWQSEVGDARLAISTEITKYFMTNKMFSKREITEVRGHHVGTHSIYRPSLLHIFPSLFKPGFQIAIVALLAALMST